MICVKSIMAGIVAVAIATLVAMAIIYEPAMSMYDTWHTVFSSASIATVTEGPPALLNTCSGFLLGVPKVIEAAIASKRSTPSECERKSLPIRADIRTP